MSKREVSADQGVKYYYECGKFRKILFSPKKREGFVPEKGSEIYVTNIPEEASVYDLGKFFERVGEVFQVRLMMKANNKQNRGFAYVTYMKKEYAMRAIDELKHQPFFSNILLGMEKSLDNCRIFIGGIPLNKTKDEIWHELLSKYKVSNIVDVITYRSYGNPTFNRGFVFLEFRTHEEASYFRAKWSGKLELFGKSMLVDWSIPVLEPGEDEMAKVTIIYLRNLNVVQSSEDFAREMYKLTERKSVEKIYKFKDYSYIHMNTRKDAERIMQVLKAYYKNTDVEITWAKPPNKFNDPQFRQKTLLTRRQYCNPLSPVFYSDEVYYDEIFNRNLHQASSAGYQRSQLSNFGDLPLPPEMWKTTQVQVKKDSYEILMHEFPPLPKKDRGDRVNRYSTNSDSSSSHQSCSSSFSESPTSSSVASNGLPKQHNANGRNLYNTQYVATEANLSNPNNQLFYECTHPNNIYSVFQLKSLYEDILQQAYFESRQIEQQIKEYKAMKDLESLAYKNGRDLMFKDTDEDPANYELEKLTTAMINNLLKE